MRIAFLVILIDLIGFGVLVPVFAFFALNMGAEPEVATALMSLYMLAMFITAPFLGRLSDHYGRKPVLALSMAGATAGYLLLANADSLWIIALARLLSGAMAGNIATAQAYITDVTSEQDRAKGMGLIGAAFGLGFIIGPALGSYLAGDDFQNANLALTAYVSAGLSFTACLAVLLLLKESLSPEQRRQARDKPRIGRMQEFRAVMGKPALIQLLMCGSLVGLTAGFFEPIFPIWASHAGTDLLDGPKDLMPLLLTGGISLAIVQGMLVGPMARRFGEQRLLVMAAMVYGAGLVIMTVMADLRWMPGIYLAMVLVSSAGAVCLTCVQSLVSQTSAADERGLVMGVYNSVGTIARFVGTVLTGVVLTRVAVHAPFYVGAVLMLGLVVLASVSLRRSTKEAGAA